MKKFGIQNFNNSLDLLPIISNPLYLNGEMHQEITEVLQRFQSGYTERDLNKVDVFVNELFITSEETYVLGTGTGELFLGIERVKTLIKDDWEYWGDVVINSETAHITMVDNVVWFTTSGTVKYNFEDTPQRYDNYINFIKNKANEEGLTAKQKIAFINWVLALTYHQREDKPREYLWPLCLSGVLKKDSGKWKIVQLHFSIAQADFPDERFENTGEYQDNYNKQNDMVDEYKSNHMTTELKTLLNSFTSDFIGQKNITKIMVEKYFTSENKPYVIGPKMQWCDGGDQIKDYFSSDHNLELSLDLEHAIASRTDRITWFTVTGLLKQNLSEDELMEQMLKEIKELVETENPSKEKIFTVKKGIAYLLKENAIGDNYTYPIRLSGVIQDSGEGPLFHYIHFSFPSYWILEGKLD